MKLSRTKQLLTAMFAVLIATSAFGQTLEPIQIGTPALLEAHPAAVKLFGNRQNSQLVITGKYEDGSVQDLTRVAEFASSNPQVAEVEGTKISPRGDGQAEIKVTVGGKEVTVAVEVSNYGQVDSVSFLYGTLAALSKQGCNAGACHGSPSGKGGFRLSLRAFDPVLDELTLIREDFGRRADVVSPDDSLLLLKPLMKVAHGGGRQIRKDDPSYQVLRDWISEGLQMDPDGYAKVVGIDVYPPSGRILKRPAHTQQLSVTARFSDGTTKDVTELAVYSSSDTEVAGVDADGLVVGENRGEAAIVVRYLEFIESTFLTFVQDIDGFVWNNPPVNNYVDTHVNAKLQQLKYLPSETCTDDEFIRRVYLDVIGVMPPVEAVEAFLADASETKRAVLIDSLLDQPEHAKFWALKWGDLLRLTNGQVGADGVHKYYRWLERAFRDNMPYDEFARQLLTSTGSTLTNPPANFYRTADDMNDCVETISQVFLGARLQCAKCHNHPFERWTQDNYYGMGAFFNRIQRKKTQRADELFVYVARSGEVTQPRTQQQMKPWLPGEGDVENPDEIDRRRTFAAWLTKPDNPFFGKIEVNRIWGHLLGRGIVDPVDDFRDTNPPSNAALLDALAKDFAENGYDRKHIVRTILNSRTYQASFRPNEFNEEDVRFFSHYQPRLLSAEQLLDAICHVTDLNETFGSLPPGTKATQLPAPDLVNNDFLKIFGQPERQTVCACERTSESNLGMAIQFFNGPLVYNKLRDENNRFRKLLSQDMAHEEVVRKLYMAAVCRTPSDAELQASMNHLNSKENKVEAFEDLCWALLNTNEFLFQH